MSNAERMPKKDPGETIVLCWDYTEDLDQDPDSPAIGITGVPDIEIWVDQSLRRGADPAVSSMLVGSPQVIDKQVLQAVSAGVDQVDYKVRCAVAIDSSPGLLIYKTSILPVRVQ